MSPLIVGNLEQLLTICGAPRNDEESVTNGRLKPSRVGNTVFNLEHASEDGLCFVLPLGKRNKSRGVAMLRTTAARRQPAAVIMSSLLRTTTLLCLFCVLVCSATNKATARTGRSILRPTGRVNEWQDGATTASAHRFASLHRVDSRKSTIGPSATSMPAASVPIPLFSPAVSISTGIEPSVVVSAVLGQPAADQDEAASNRIQTSRAAQVHTDSHGNHYVLLTNNNVLAQSLPSAAQQVRKPHQPSSVSCTK